MRPAKAEALGSDTERFMPHAKRRGYLMAAKSWKIRNMIEGYVSARLALQQHWRPKVSDHHMPSFEVLKKMCDILQHVKDDHHLIYRRADSPNGRDERHKLVPGFAETAFINHIGLLFHKAMVAKELRYILERYAHDERNWEVHFQELQTNLTRIEKLFEQDQEAITNFIRGQAGNVLVLAFLLENQRAVAKCFGMRPTEVLGHFVNEFEPPEVYFRVAQYYSESGWYERAQETALKAAPKFAEDERLPRLLQHIENKLGKQKRGARGAENGMAAASTIDETAD